MTFLRVLVAFFFCLGQLAWADTQPRLKTVPSLGWSLDRIVDPTSIGTVTGTDVAFSGLSNCSAITTDSAGNFICSAAAAGSGDITAVTAGNGLTGGAASGAATLDVGEGLAIDVAADSVAFDPTELTGSRTWSDGSTDTNVWTLNRLSGTDPTLTFGSATVTGQVVAASTAFEVNGEQISDFTGSGITIVGGALTASSGSGDITSVGDVASGAAFDGTQGTVLTFNNAGGDGTLDYDGTDFSFNDPITIGSGANATETITSVLSGATDPVLTFSNNTTAVTGNVTSTATVTGVTVHASTALQVGSDYITDITGSGLSVSGGVLTASGGTSHNILSSTHSDSNANAVSRGSLIYGNSTPAWDELTVGATSSVLTANGTDASWSTTPTVVNIIASSTVTGAVVAATTQLRVPSADDIGTISGVDGEGAVTWESDTNELSVGTGSTNVRVGKFPLGAANVTSRAVDFFLSWGSGTSTGGEDAAPAPFAMTCRNFRATVDDPPGAGNTWTVTIQEQGVATALTCIIDGDAGDINCSTPVGTEEAFAAGNQIRALFDETGTVSATSSQTWSMECYPD